MVELAGFRRAKREFFDRPVLEVAPLLLGSVLVQELPTGPVGIRLTEVEAYGGSVDPGSHSFRGPTPRNASMFGPPGHLYCYFTYGMHHAINIVCDSVGIGTGCLLRAGEVIVGLELAHRRREMAPGGKPRLKALSDQALARGPGNLAQVFAATRADTDGADLCAAAGEWSCWLPDEGGKPSGVQTSGRVGVGGAGGDAASFSWRFYLAGEPSVSAYRAAATRTAAR